MEDWYSDIFKDKETADKWIPLLDSARKKFYKHKVTQTVSSLPMLDFDKLYEYNRTTCAELVPVGHDDQYDNIDEMKKALFQSSDGSLNFVAQCKCGFMRGNYHLGDICPKCHTKVETSFSNEINIRAWVEIPEELPPFLHPVAYRVLNKWIGIAKHKNSILNSIMNTEMDLPAPYNQGILSTKAPLGQGMWYFYNNFWDIINYIASTHKGNKALNDEKVLTFLKQNGEPTDEQHPYGCLFCRHIPILNQSLHVLTHSGSMTYNDDPSTYIFEACLELGEVIKQIRHSPKRNENLLDQQVFNVYKAWSEYTTSVIDSKIIHKSGFIRKNILGTRLHWTGRGVIVPIIGRHWADEIELPWRMVVGLFKLEIVNKLKLNYGFDVNTALQYWQQAQTGLSPDIPEGKEKDKVVECISYVKTCLDQLHAECPFKGWPIIMGRNPTLRQGEITPPLVA